MPIEFDPFRAFHAKLLQIADGDMEEAKLLLRAANKAGRSVASMRGTIDFDNFQINHFRRSFVNRHGNAFRDAQLLNDQELSINARRLAFQGVPDGVREEHSAFCLLMYQGKQIRFLDRHPGETPEAFANRPRKTALNITRVIINALSKLYAKRPARKLSDATSPQIKQVLVGDESTPGIWNDEYDLELLETDRYTRLEGTTSIRPFFDDDVPGKIKLVVFHSHQLRVIRNPAKPWKPKAVIERHNPFAGKGTMIIWTERTFLQLNPDGSVDESSGPHNMKRIPHTFFRDSKATTGSFFVEGRGRGLCDGNAVVNAKLTDLNEVYQYQGFAVPQIVNWEDEDGNELVFGPRRPIKFNNVAKGQPHGVEFKAPPSQMPELREEINADIDAQFRINGVPPAATGAAINQRSLSGKSIRESMRPLLDDFEERARVFAPFDQDLADNALSVRSEHDPAFDYDRAAQRPKYQVDYQEPSFPLDSDERIKGESHDLAFSMRTEPEIMMERDPDRFQSIEQAQEQHQKNRLYQASNPPLGTGAEEEVPGEDITEALTAPVNGGLNEGDLAWIQAELRADPGANGTDLIAEFARGKIKA